MKKKITLFYIHFNCIDYKKQLICNLNLQPVFVCLITLMHSNMTSE